jgi:membrane associated rhomboid family serine protease
MVELKNKPISICIGVIIVIIYLLYNMNIIKGIPCKKNIPNIFINTFTHIDNKHLISNLLTLWALSRVEKDMGFKPFLWLLVFLIIFNTIIEYIFVKLYKDVDCGIGFSGILFGIMTWEIVTKNDVSTEIILTIAILVAAPSLQSKNASLVGHIIGALSGIISGLLWKMIN